MCKVDSTPASCFIIGEDSLVIQCAEILLRENFKLLAIISDNPAIKTWASIHHITVLESIESILIIEKKTGFDYLFSIVNSKILPKKILKLPRRYAINFHNSPLPKYAGLNATTWAILNNEKTYGVSWHLMNETVDAGDILKQPFFRIEEYETTLSLNLKCYEYAVESFQELAIELKENLISKKKQDLSKRSYYGLDKHISNDGFISWSQSAEKISLLCRALTFGNYFNSLGSAKWILKNQILTVKDHQILSIQSNKPPGTIVFISKNSLQVSTATNDIAIVSVSFENGEKLSIIDLVEKFEIYVGYSLKPVNRRYLIQRIDYKNNRRQFFILNPCDKKKIIHTWNNTKIKYSYKKTVCKIFEEQVAKTPHSIAAIFKNENITYKELNQKSNKLAHYLRERGIRSETLVGICIERSLDMIISILGVMKAGAAYLPLNPTYPVERLSYMLNDSQSSLLILNQLSLKNKFNSFAGEILHLQSSLKINQRNEKNPKNSTHPNHLAYVIYTSGTTGKPKGVEITHHSLHNHMMWMKNQFDFDEDDIFFQKTPFSFDASVWEFFIASYVGSQLVIAPSNAHTDPQQLIDLIIKHKITVLQVVPTMLKELLAKEEFKHCRELKQVFCGGEALPPNTIREFFEKMPIKLHNLYGPTEATIDATSLQCTPIQGKINSCLIGKPIMNTQVYVLDKEMKIMPIGTPGELYIGGQCLARGYLNQPELTQLKFLPNPFSRKIGSKLYKTGDLVQWQPDGNLEYLGRCDDQVKIRGCRVELNEIETHLSKFPLVQQCIVTTKNDSQGYLALSAYILPKNNLLISSQELQLFLRQSLPTYMIPSYFFIVDKFLLTPSGKIDRKNLSHSCTLLLNTNKNNSPPRTPEEQVLVNILESILHITPIGIHDNFFDLGGDSLSALRFSTLIEEKLSVKLNIGKLFELTTIAELAKVIFSKTPHRQKKMSTIKKSSLIQLYKGIGNPPIFLIHPIGGSIFWYKYLAKYIDRSRSLYAIQDPGIETQELLFQSIEEMAKFYINIIQMIQPNGPYLLGGASFGATVAVEIARQLLEVDQKIAFIALLDGWSSYYALASDQNRFESLMRKQNQKIFNHSLHTDIINSEFLLKLQWHREKILTHYQMPYLNTKFTLFKAQELWDIFDKDPPFNGWENYSSFPIERHIVPGNHETMFYEPHVQSLAKKLNQCLESLLNADKIIHTLETVDL
jgi:amino acid adenylation domain-containing protein